MGVGESQELRAAPDSVDNLWPVKGIIRFCVIDRIAAEQRVTGGKIVVQSNLRIMFIDR